MFTIKNKKHGIDFYKVWFAKQPLNKPGIIAYHQAFFDNGHADEFDTLLSDISLEPDEIKAAFSKSCRYKVNRAEREDIKVMLLDAADITDDDIDSFVEFFGNFWRSKGGSLSSETSIRNDLRSYRDANALSFSKALVRGEIAVYHTHVYDNERARLLHSASLYRLIGDDESDSRNLIGMANRYLHYADMLHFKEKGLRVYDWGGAGRGEEVANITEFKESFGGIPEKNYDFEETVGIKAHLFKFLINVLDDSLLNRIRGK